MSTKYHAHRFIIFRELTICRRTTNTIVLIKTVEIVNNRYVLSPEKQAELFDIFFTINPSHFKLEEQSIVNPVKNLRLDIKYPSYNLVDGVVFPSEINVKAKNSKSVTDIDFFYKSVVFDTDLNMSFNIPSTYKRLEF